MRYFVASQYFNLYLFYCDFSQTHKLTSADSELFLAFALLLCIIVFSGPKLWMREIQTSVTVFYTHFYSACLVGVVTCRLLWHRSWKNGPNEHCIIKMSSELFSGSENARIDDRGAAVLPSNYGTTPQVTVVDARSVNGNLSQWHIYLTCYIK